MPIVLNDKKTNVKNAASSAYNVKFFGKDFTGTGKAIGLINASMNPINLPPLTTSPSKSHARGMVWVSKIKKTTDKYSKTVTYPIAPLGNYTSNSRPIQSLKSNACEIGESSDSKLFMEFTPAYIGITEPLATANQNANAQPTSKKLNVLYRVNFIEEKIDGAGVPAYKYVENYLCENPALFLKEHVFLNSMVDIDVLTIYHMSDKHKDNYAAYLKDYDLYSELNEVSKIWQTTVTDDIIAAYDAGRLNAEDFPMRELCKYISLYRLSMSQYSRFYQELKIRLTLAEMKSLTKVNTYLLLQETMDNLKQIQFASLPSPANIPNYQSPNFSWCSKEQHAAITSNAPLNLIQAGAGTGKSTTIKARIEYLLSIGVPASDILVLSFTNAAADNMKEKAPNIQSMTIAKMIDTIYTLNHPTHKLASSASRKGEGSTFTNSLSLYSDVNPLADRLISASNKAESKNDYATLLNLVEEEYDDVIALLDQVQQTTFQLEIILTYLEHAKLNIPFANITHLIIDEVQDNAVFEFIFFLNLTCKLKNHLYLVGDCSQTLYEFRASDPKALSVIENSGVFKTFPLNVNYRSNQAILNFANSLLDNIEANQNAKIQLQSFTLGQLTQQDFQDVVVVDYERMDKLRNLPENLEKRFHSKIRPWINDALKKGEQICVLTYTRRESEMIQKIVENLFPSASTISIIPAKNIAFAYFSKYVSFCADKIAVLPTTDAAALCAQVCADIIANLQTCNIDPSKPQYPKIQAKVTALLDKWQKENFDLIGDYLKRFNSGAITREELSKIIGETLVDFEINQNALRQSMTSQRNASRKTNTDRADFVFSTIHSAKGLEFDRVILLYHNQNNMSEEDKRMYYVGLTRAKKSEYIIGYDTVATALLVTRYEDAIQRLPVNLVIGADGQVASVINNDGSVLNADGTGLDARGNELLGNGAIAFTNGEIITPDKDGTLDLTKKAV